MVHNAGNYFSFPVYVLGKTTGASAESPLAISNTATGETMKVVKDIPEGKQLVVDVGARRVALVTPDTLPQTWVWNARNYISLSSSWVTLAAGDNQFVIDPNDAISPIPPKIYWRDTWIGSVVADLFVDQPSSSDMFGVGSSPLPSGGAGSARRSALSSTATCSPTCAPASSSRCCR